MAFESLTAVRSIPVVAGPEEEARIHGENIVAVREAVVGGVNSFVLSAEISVARMPVWKTRELLSVYRSALAERASTGPGEG
jgi:hypothetical protein